MRLINADAVRLKFQQIFDIYRETIDAVKCRPGAVENAIKLCTMYLDEQPTIEAEPVRHGRWKFEKGDNKATIDGWICTACNYGYHTKVPYFECFKYCPMCGARMDGGADNGNGR